MKKIFVVLLSSSMFTSLQAHDMPINSGYNFSHKNIEPFQVPDIGSGVGLIDQYKERQIGEQVYRQVQQQMPVLHDVWLEEQLSPIFYNILSQAQLGKPIGLVVVKDSQINAFAVPGGLFALNTGLITTARNMDEVVGVMAHEVAHVSQRHFSRSQDAFKGQGLLALAGIIVGAAIASQVKSGDAGAAVMMGTQAALLDKQLSYSRNQEREADRIGMQYMYAAGYNPQSMADFFEVMNRASTGVSYLPSFWLTHPLTTERMSEARLRASQLPQIKSKLYDPDFQILKWYTLVMSNQATEQQLKAQDAENNHPAQLALSAFYNQQGDYQQAQTVLNKVKPFFPANNLVILLQTDIYLNQKQLDQAYETIASRQKVMPENRALAYKLAEVLIKQNKLNDAKTLVEGFLNKNPRDLTGWSLMQKIAYAGPDSPVKAINVLRYRAEIEFWSGQEERAIKSLLHAQRLALNNQSLSSTITTRLKQMQADYSQKL